MLVNWVAEKNKCYWSQNVCTVNSCIVDTLIIWTAARTQAKNELQMFDWYKLPLLQTLSNEDTTLANEEIANLFYLPWIYVYLT